jgi:hypothetical protein
MIVHLVQAVPENVETTVRPTDIRVMELNII